jgi:RNAse (barnase) inhibitor barstar
MDMIAGFMFCIALRQGPWRPVAHRVNWIVASRRVYEIDGTDFASLEDFFDEISRKLIPDASWGRNLDAFNDVLRGGFGTPKDGFVLRWKNSQISRERLGYAETIRQLQSRLARCHATNRYGVAEDLAAAEAHRGETVFDWLVDIVHIHCAGGPEQEDGVELDLC